MSPSRHSKSPYLFALFFFLFLSSNGVLALVQQFCSSENTNSSYTPVYYQYMSNGQCKTICNSGYAYGIVQGFYCWCSNTAPGNTVSVSECSEPCPGFSEFCGNSATNLFGYVELDLPPSSTLANAPSTTSTPSATPIATTIYEPASIIFVTQSAAPPVTTVITQIGPSIQTVVITPTQSSTPQSTSMQTSTAATSSNAASISPVNTNTTGRSGFWSNTGAVAGVFTVVGVVGLLILLGLAFLIYRWRKKSAVIDEKAARTSNDEGHERSSLGFLADRRRSDLITGFGGVNNNNGTVASREHSNEKTSTLGGMSMSPNNANGTGTGRSRTMSGPMGYDQRLNPTVLFGGSIDGEGSARNSFASLRDDRDYTRPALQIRNPDAEF